MNAPKFDFEQRSLTRYRPDWATPPELFAKYDAEFQFTLDAAASVENAKCLLYYTRETDGLAADWGSHSVWCNPPYGVDLARWVAKCAEARQTGATIVALIPARTDTRWWHEHIWDRENRRPRPGIEIDFIKARVKFIGAPHNAPFPSCAVIFRPERAA